MEHTANSTSMIEAATREGTVMVPVAQQLHNGPRPPIESDAMRMGDLTGRRLSLQSDLCRVKVENGMQYVCLPDGRKIPGQTETVVKQTVNGACTVTVTLMAKLDDTAP